MVKVGELELEGKINDGEIVSGLNRLVDQLKSMQEESAQLNATTNRTLNISRNLTKTFLALGVAGTAAMTALAVKSPVLAATMAKIELQTLKLSNTVGRQLKPIFESIANNLIPSINEAFFKSGNIIGETAESVGDLVDALSALIRLDLKDVKTSLVDLFQPESFEEDPGLKASLEARGGGPFVDTVQTARDIISGAQERDVSEQIRFLATGGNIREGGKLAGNLIIDTIEALLFIVQGKQLAMTTADGVPRGSA